MAVSLDDQAYLGNMSAYRFAEEDGGLHTIIGIIETRDRVSRAKTVAIQAEITSDGSIVELWGLGLHRPKWMRPTGDTIEVLFSPEDIEGATGDEQLAKMDVAPFRLLWTRS